MRMAPLPTKKIICHLAWRRRQLKSRMILPTLRRSMKIYLMMKKRKELKKKEAGRGEPMKKIDDYVHKLILTDFVLFCCIAFILFKNTNET